MLKALELTGFKSFADRTKFQFPGGVTVVVGPNGSGKSNVVDAMKWVLGTQSAKSLRGGEMRDVIFNGARSRKPLNAAEATLTLDNSQGTFPLEGAEVQITRRVYRSGEAEYLLNRQPCRLRDIRDLLSAAGIANEAYGIIEQGKVDAMLQAAPRERRAIFEEAAGINRFRAKKQEAARRLERVEQNLLRLTDIVAEVESRLKSIRAQAGKAQRYREQADRLQHLRTQIGLADWHKFTEELINCESRVRRLVTADSHLRQQVAASESTASQLNEEAEAIAATVRECEAEIGKTREHVAEHKSLCFVLTQRVDDLATEVGHARRQWLAMNARSEGHDDANRDAVRGVHLAQDALETARAQFGRIKALLDECRNQWTDLRQEREQLRQAHADAMTQAAAAAQQEQVLKSRYEASRAAERQAAEETDRLAAQRDQIAEEFRKTKELEAAAVAEATLCSTQLAAAQRRLDERRREITTSHRQLTAVESELSRLNHRRELLEEQHRRVDRLEQDLQALMPDSSPSGELQVFHGQVADVVRVEADLAPLVETALGERARDILLNSGSDLMTAVANAPRLANRLVFSRLDWRSPASAVDRVNLLGEPGVLGRADQYVEADQQYQLLVRRLLGRTWLVDTLDTAIRLAESAGRGLNFVTAAGEYLSADGVIAIGPRPEAAGLLTWRTELQSIQQQLMERQRRRSELQAAIEVLETAAENDAAEVHDRLAAHKPLVDRVASLGQQRAALAERHDQLVAQHQRTTDQKRHLDRELAQADKELTRMAETSHQLQGQAQQLLRTIGTITARANELELRCSQLQEATTERQVTLAKAEQHLEILRAQAAQHLRDQQEREQALQEGYDRLQRAVAELREQELALLAHGSAVAELAVLQEATATQLRGASNRDQQLRAKRSGLTQQMQRLRREMEQLASQRQQLELRISEIKLERRTLADRMQEDFGIDLAAAAAGPQPLHFDEVDASRSELENLIAELRSSLNVIGPVNLNAIEELEQLETRFATLAAQHRDLTQAKVAIEQLLVRINGETRELFLTTLELIRGHFQELFRRLFGGGEADLVLITSDGEDVLDGGVEITACPPGKETRTISLLSGGEKTLTCIALLLAVFRSRPSPFCILDEVDAALDEANIARFINVLSEFLSATQFVVVTHSKRTMAGAQTLLGVTMQESGVSKQIAVRLEDVDEEGSIQPSAARMAA